MTCQRGTDLEHCPDGCEGLIWNETPECSVANDCNFTCPREQEEKLAKSCATCDRTAGVGSQTFVFCRPLVKRMPREFSCGSWKERTNG